jgi:hypothetical protein
MLVELLQNPKINKDKLEHCKKSATEQMPSFIVSNKRLRKCDCFE